MPLPTFSGKINYKSDIQLGEKYRDEQTGYEGTAVAIYFYQHACERVSLECFDATTKKVIDTVFDSPRLTHIESGKKATTSRTGGPERGTGSRGAEGMR